MPRRNLMASTEARRIAALLLSDVAAEREEGMGAFLGQTDGALLLDVFGALGEDGDAVLESLGARAAALEEPLVALLDDPARAADALRLLARVGLPRALAAVARAASQPALREPALRALSAIAHRAGGDAVPHLLALSGDASLLELFESSLDLGAAGGDALRACFGQMGEANQRRLAARLAAGSEAAVALLVALAGDTASAGQAVALEALAAHLSASGPARLVALFRDPVPALRAAAARALALRQERGAAGALIDALADRALWSDVHGDEHAEVLGAFLDALGALGRDESALAALLRHAPVPRRVGLH